MRDAFEWMFQGLSGLPLLLFQSYPIHAWVAFRKAGVAPEAEASQRVSVIVPLHGAEPELRSNLRSLLEQDSLADYEVLLCMEDASDDAAAIVEQLSAEIPGRARLVFSGPAGAELGKLHNLMAGVAAASGSLFVFVDGDARLPSRTYLAKFIAPLANPSIGCVTCYPIYRGGRDLGTLLLAGLINVDLRGTFVVRSAWGGGAFANGACMALRKETLERAGGLGRLRRRMLMDSRLAQNVTRLGLRTVVHPHPVLIDRERTTLREMWDQSTRWHVAMFRGLEPWTWVAFGWLRSALLLAVVHLLATPDSLTARGVLTGIVCVRAGQAATLPGAGWRIADVVRRAIAQPFADILGAIAWLFAMSQSTVRWRDRRYRVAPGGEMTLVRSPARREGVAPPVPARAATRGIGEAGFFRERPRLESGAEAHRDAP